MFRLRKTALMLIAIGIGGCENGAPSFTGDIQPITEPIRLAYAPFGSAPFSLTFDMTVSHDGVPNSRLEAAEGRIGITRAADGLLSLTIETIRTAAQGPGPIRLSSWTRVDGSREIAIGPFGAIAAASNGRPDSDFGMLVPIWPEIGVRSGSEIPYEVQSACEKTDGGSGCTATVLGLAEHDGRSVIVLSVAPPALVAGLGGIGGGGYALVDRLSGLVWKHDVVIRFEGDDERGHWAVVARARGEVDM